MNNKEVRIRYTGNTAYYVLSDACRAELLALIDTIQTYYIPDNYNKFDEDALQTMNKWLREDRDFNTKQWTKFGKMLGKYELPENIVDFINSAGWTMGSELNSTEMYNIMEGRRNKKREDTFNSEVRDKWVASDATTFGKLFTANDK